MDTDLPSAALRDHWAEVEVDLEARADALASAGWTVLSVPAGDVTSRPASDPPALDILVPRTDLEAIEALLADDVTITETAVYRSAAGGVAFLICVLQDPERRVSVLIPAFYPQRGRRAIELATHAREADGVHLRLRSLDRSHTVLVSIDDPTLIFPEQWP